MTSTTNAPTPLGLARATRRPLVADAGTPAAARPPLAAIVMRVAFDRVVLWTTCIDTCDGDLQILSGRVEPAKASGEEAPGEVFKLAAVQVLPELADTLRHVAQRSGAGFIELAIPNTTLRALAQEVADGLGPARVLSSSEIVRLLPVDRAVAEADALYAHALAGRTQDGTCETRGRHRRTSAPVVVATDASVRRRHVPAGIAWVRPDGVFATDVVETSDIAVAELAAIAAAIEAHGKHAGRLVVRSDSREALTMATAALEGHCDARTAAARRHQRRIVASPIRKQVRLEWVKGHRGDRLNETADSLAVMARRHHDIGLPRAEHRARASQEVKEMLAELTERDANG